MLDALGHRRGRVQIICIHEFGSSNFLVALQLQEIEDYRYFDPKMVRGTEATVAQRNKTNFQEVSL